MDRYKRERLGQARRPGNGQRAEGKPVDTVKPGTINRELAVLSHLLNKAVEWGWLAHHPAKIRRLKEGSGRLQHLTVEEAERLRQTARGDQNPHVYLFTCIGLETGMRKMEILRLRREHVHLDRLVLYIPSAKAGAREQPITGGLASQLRGHLATLPAHCEWLFPSKRAKAGHARDVKDAFKRAVEAAGLDPKSVVRHTLRHTAITHLVQAGIDLPNVQRISGHKTLAMVARYAHAHGAHVQAAMSVLERRYGEAREQQPEQRATITPLRRTGTEG